MTRRRARRGSRAARRCVREIAERRRADVGAELDALGRELRRAVAAAPAPRPVVDALAAPGLHVIAEVKRRSPSAGAIAAADDAVARARAYAGGRRRRSISVLCEPHWFGGSIDDLRAVRAAVAVPVLAKEFVVDPRQLPLLRRAGRRPRPAARRAAPAGAPRAARRRRRATSGSSRSSRPTTRGSWRPPWRPTRGSSAINNRDLRTLEVDPERAVRLRELIPATGSSSPSPASATRRPSPAGARPGSTPRSSARR